MFIKLLNQNKTKDDFFKNEIMQKKSNNGSSIFVDNIILEIHI